MVTEPGRALDHVLWIGGSPCAGKSTVAEMLGHRYRLPVYHFDQHEAQHWDGALTHPERNPALAAFMAMSMDERWVHRSPEGMAANTIASWTERFSAVLEDLSAIGGNRPIIAEGPGLFPDCVHPLLANHASAIWLISSPDLIRRVRIVRNAGVSFQETADPPLALENLVQRDIVLAEYVRERARALELPSLEVSGATDVADVAVQVERHFSTLRD